MGVHPRRVGVLPGEQLEAVGGLADVHVAAVERRAADSPRRLQQRRVERHIHDIRDPHRGPQPFLRQRYPGMSSHAGRRAMNEPVGCLHGSFQILCLKCLSIRKERTETRGKRSGARRIDIENPQLPNPQAECGIPNGSAGAAGAEQDYARPIRLRQRALETPGPAGGVGVVPDQPIAGSHHGIDRADGLGFL